MYVRDIMTTNVVTIPSTTSVTDAKRIMEAHRMRRLPVVDNGKLVGIINGGRLEGVSPTKATSLSIWELSYVLDKTKVREVMETRVVTVTPDMTVEESLAIAQNNRVGALVVVANGRVVGIVTTNDYFYKIVNPTLGLGEKGTRIEVIGGGEGHALEEVMHVVNQLDMKVVMAHTLASTESTAKSLFVQVESDNVSPLVTELEGKGYQVRIRQR